MSYKNSLYDFFKSTSMHSVLGIILGITIDRIIARIQNRVAIKKSTNEHSLRTYFIFVVLQLIVTIYVIYFFETYVSKAIASEWHTITPGFFFVAFYFGTQENLFDNIGNFADILENRNLENKK